MSTTTNAIDNGSAAGPLFMTASAPLRMAVFELHPENFLSLVGPPAQLTALPPGLADVKIIQLRSKHRIWDAGVPNLVDIFPGARPGRAGTTPDRNGATATQLHGFCHHSIRRKLALHNLQRLLRVCKRGRSQISPVEHLYRHRGTSTSHAGMVSVTLIVAAPGQMSVTPSAP